MTILLVEDQRYNLLVLEKLLERLGTTVLKAENGIEAVDICKGTEKIDLVLMDLKMPVMDGYSAMREIRKIRPGLKIVAQTAYAMAGDEKRILEAGFDDYLAKPITRENLVVIISRNI
ncbi:MAG: response regulator [Bacteroidales bacterium]